MGEIDANTAKRLRQEVLPMIMAERARWAKRRWFVALLLVVLPAGFLLFTMERFFSAEGTKVVESVVVPIFVTPAIQQIWSRDGKLLSLAAAIRAADGDAMNEAILSLGSSIGGGRKVIDRIQTILDESV